MKSPRIRHLVQPTMSVADRNLSITNEVRTIMTTTAFPVRASRSSTLQGFELLVSRIAVSMLRWSEQRSARRRPTHDEMMLLRQNQKDSARASNLARLS